MTRIKASKDTVIYSIGIGQALRNYAEAHGSLGQLCPLTDFSCKMSFDLADKQMNAFAKMTGGRAYFPLFDGQLKYNFEEIGNTIRSQYSISYQSTNATRDGSYRKVQVELVDASGLPLKIRTEKGRDIQSQVLVREGYKAPVEAK